MNNNRPGWCGKVGFWRTSTIPGLHGTDERNDVISAYLARVSLLIYSVPIVVFPSSVNKQNVGGISPKEKEIYVGGGGWLCSHSLRRIIRVLVETDRTDFIERGDVFSLRNTEAFLSATRTTTITV